MARFHNPKKDAFLKSRPQTDVSTSKIASKCKFNFAFFDASQGKSQSFEEWNVGTGSASLLSLLKKIKDYTNESLSYWKNQRAGGGGLKVLAYYDEFPKKSEFKHPVHVPHDALWARFRLGNKVRLIGFVLPEKFNGGKFTCTDGKTYRYDTNTFYVVFLDKNHHFYSVEKE